VRVGHWQSSRPFPPPPDPSPAARPLARTRDGPDAMGASAPAGRARDGGGGPARGQGKSGGQNGNPSPIFMPSRGKKGRKTIASRVKEGRLCRTHCRNADSMPGETEGHSGTSDARTAGRWRRQLVDGLKQEQDPRSRIPPRWRCVQDAQTPGSLADLDLFEISTTVINHAEPLRPRQWSSQPCSSRSSLSGRPSPAGSFPQKRSDCLLSNRWRSGGLARTRSKRRRSSQPAPWRSRKTRAMHPCTSRW